MRQGKDEKGIEERRRRWTIDARTVGHTGNFNVTVLSKALDGRHLANPTLISQLPIVLPDKTCRQVGLHPADGAVFARKILWYQDEEESEQNNRRSQEAKNPPVVFSNFFQR